MLQFVRSFNIFSQFQSQFSHNFAGEDINKEAFVHILITQSIPHSQIKFSPDYITHPSISKHSYIPLSLIGGIARTIFVPYFPFAILKPLVITDCFSAVILAFSQLAYISKPKTRSPFQSSSLQAKLLTKTVKITTKKLGISIYKIFPLFALDTLSKFKFKYIPCYTFCAEDYSSPP